VSAIFLLGSAHMCMFFESSGLSIIMDALQSFMVFVRKRIEEDNADVESVNSSIMFNRPDLLKRLRETAQILLGRYMRLQCKKLARMIKKGVEMPNWMKMKEPRDVRLATCLFLEEMYRIHTEVAHLFQARPLPIMHLETPTTTIFGSPISRSRNSSVPDLSSMERTAVASEVASKSPRFSSMKFTARHMSPHRRIESTPLITSIPSPALFSKKKESVFVTPVFCTTESILVGIIKLSFKSFTECVRACTLGRHGYQQMQVDIEFMRRMLTDLLPDASAQTQIMAILKEFERETTERSINSIGMEPTIISRLCDEKLAKWTAQGKWGKIPN